MKIHAPFLDSIFGMRARSVYKRARLGPFVEDEAGWSATLFDAENLASPRLAAVRVDHVAVNICGGNEEAVVALFAHAIDAAYRDTWGDETPKSPPSPRPFRIGLRSPKRLQMRAA